MNNKKPTAAERIQALTETGEVVVMKNPKIERLNSEGTVKKIDGRKNNGGARIGSGGSPGGQALARRSLRAILASHYAEPIIIELKDPLTGELVKMKKPRVLAMMEKMYEIAVEKNDSNAGDRWLNRALGKAPQPLIGDEEEDPIRVDLGIDRILGKVYNGDNDEG